MEKKIELIKKCNDYFKQTFGGESFKIDQNTTEEELDQILSLILNDWEGFEIIANEIKNIL